MFANDSVHILTVSADLEEIPGITLEECKERCRLTTGCRSIDFSVPRDKCYLNRLSPFDPGANVKIFNSMDTYTFCTEGTSSILIISKNVTMPTESLYNYSRMSENSDGPIVAYYEEEEKWKNVSEISKLFDRLHTLSTRLNIRRLKADIFKCIFANKSYYILTQIWS